MISILFNPHCPGFVFAAAALTRKLEESYPKEIIDLIPFYPIDFGKTIEELYDTLSEEMEEWTKIQAKVASETGYSLEGIVMEDYPDKIALLGIYPSSPQEANCLITFFENQVDNIITWIDWHEWPPGLAEFFHSQNKEVIVSPEESPLRLIEADAPFELVRAERALLRKKMRNPLARRYLKAYRYTKIISYESQLERVCFYGLFTSIVDEIILAEEDLLVSVFEENYLETMIKTREVINRLTDDHPAFAEAKQINRPVGFLLINERESVDLAKIIKEGLKRYPWLLSISVLLKGGQFLRLESAKIPIIDLLQNYTDALEDPEVNRIMSIANKIVVGYKEEEA